MHAFTTTVSHFLQNSNFAAAFFDASLKSLGILTLAGGWCICWRRAAAATRHLIWFLAVLGLALLPLLAAILPSWHKPLWSVSTSMQSGNQFSLMVQLASPDETI